MILILYIKYSVILKQCNIILNHLTRTKQEVGFHVDKRFWQKGYASSAAKACLEYIFENTDFNEIFCYQKWTNVPSRNTAKKLGMSLRKEYDDEINIKTSVYSITRSEFENQISDMER